MSLKEKQLELAELLALKGSFTNLQSALEKMNESILNLNEESKPSVEIYQNWLEVFELMRSMKNSKEATDIIKIPVTK